MSISRKNRTVARRPSSSSSRAGLRGTTASVQAERDLLISILETLSQSRHMNEYLKRLAKQVKKYSGCRCVGIRLLDDDGNIPYVAYTGFSREFYEGENPLCIKSDKCMCVNVIMGNTRLGLPSYTKGGSFLSHSTTKLLASVSEEVKSQTRNVCNQYGYESVALVPMKHGGRILGLIHLADESENKIPLKTVQFLEWVGVYIGEVLHTFMAEEALQESEKRYRDLYEEAPNAYFSVGADGYIARANRTATELLGYSRDGLIGRPVFDLYADTPNGKVKAQEVFQRFLADEEIRGEELEMCRADGSKVWVSLSVRPIRDKEGRVVASRSVVVDITKRKRAEQALQESRDYLERLTNSMWDAVFSVKMPGRVIEWANDSFKLIGYDPKECVGRTTEFLYPDKNEFLDFGNKLKNAIAAGKDILNTEQLLKRKSGEVFSAEITTTVYKEKGEVVRVTSIVRDITARKKLDQLKDDFIGLVSHELRSPMTVITGAINTALTEAERLSPEERRQLLKDASLEAELLSNLLGNLLELSRIQASRLYLHVEAISVSKVIQGTVEEIKRQSSAHQFVVSVPRKLPPVYADPLRLERILYNLLENAVKYSPQGGEIRVSTRRQKEHLVIGVSDQGVGISPADQTKLFAPFQRLEESRPGGARGVGLGLLVCRRLVEAHGGRIWVKSKPGQGSTFFFTLPLSQSLPSKKHPETQAESTS